MAKLTFSALCGRCGWSHVYSINEIQDGKIECDNELCKDEKGNRTKYKSPWTAEVTHDPQEGPPKDNPPPTAAGSETVTA